MHKKWFPKIKNQSFTLKSITTPISRVIRGDPGTLGTLGALISDHVTPICKRCTKHYSQRSKINNLHQNLLPNQFSEWSEVIQTPLVPWVPYLGPMVPICKRCTKCGSQRSKINHLHQNLLPHRFLKWSEVIQAPLVPWVPYLGTHGTHLETVHKLWFPKVKNQSFTSKSIIIPIFRVIWGDPNTIGSLGALSWHPW